MYLGGCWYQKGELARASSTVLHLKKNPSRVLTRDQRLALMNTASQIGPMVNSYLQSAAYVSLTGVHGLSGWRWVRVTAAPSGSLY